MLALAVLVALVLIDGQPAAAALLVFGFALGAVFLKAEFSFTASWRRLIVRGQADGFLGGLLLIAIAAAAIVPVAALVPGFGGAIAPIGPSLIVGAFVFGIGMQLANGCGSGTLYTVGGGSGPHADHARLLHRRQRDRQPASAGLPAARRHRSGPGLELSRPLGRPCRHLGEPWPRRARRRCHRQAARRVVHAVAADRVRRDPDRAALSIAVFAAGHHPWSVTFGFTVWGAKIATLFGADFSQAEFWQWAGPKRALGDSILSDTSSLTDLGMILGAMAAAAATAPFARNPWPPLKSLAAAASAGC